MRMRRDMELERGIAIVLLLMVIGVGQLLAQSPSTVLYSFTGGSDGAHPYAGLTTDASGNLYGTTVEGGTGSCSNFSGCGTVFELIKNPNGSFSQITLHSFTGGSDGANPYAGVIIDSSGNLYGTTEYGGGSVNCGTDTMGNLLGCGTVFELIKNSDGSYSETVLHSFTFASIGSFTDGAHPMTGLIRDSSGNLYGTTSQGGSPSGATFPNCILGCGIAFELIKNSDGSYTEELVYDFAGSYGSAPGWTPGPLSNGTGSNPNALVMDTTGDIYLTGTGVGLVELFKGTLSYTKVMLLGDWGNFNNEAALIMDTSGKLYGINTSGPFGVFEIDPGNAQTLPNRIDGEFPPSTLHAFSSADPLPTALMIDTSGNIYGTTSSSVFELLKLADGTYNPTLAEYYFTGTNGDGSSPFGAVIMDSSGNLYGTTFAGGSGNCSDMNASGCGTVFKLPPFQTTGTTTTLTSSQNPANAGDSVVFTATVASAAGVPLGSVIFSNGSTVLGTSALSSGQATLTEEAETIGIGSFTITAQYIPTTGSVLVGSSATMLQQINEAGVVLTSGTQVINGTVIATKFIGDGSGLTGITANVPNAVLTTGLYVDPPWITSLSGSKIAGPVASAMNAGTALALQFTPTQCSLNSFSIGIGANGNAYCSQPASSNLSDSGTLVLNTQANTFTGGKQTFPVSTKYYASLNLPNTGTAPTSPAVGDLWLTIDDLHLNFLDKNNTSQSLAFLSDIAASGSTLLSANNSFTGSNTFTHPISGSITGNAGTVSNGVYTTGSYADPTWITALSGSKITGPVASAATAGSAITAASATTATSANTAGNAASLGGIAAASYARLDVGNNLTGNQNVNGNLNVTGTITGAVTIGTGGTPIKEHLSVLVNPIFPALLPFSCSTASFTVTGASDGNPIALGVPNARMNQGGHIVFSAWVSAVNTVTIQACNIDSLNKQKASGSGSIRIDVWMY